LSGPQMDFDKFEGKLHGGAGGLTGDDGTVDDNALVRNLPRNPLQPRHEQWDGWWRCDLSGCHGRKELSGRRKWRQCGGLLPATFDDLLQADIIAEVVAPGLAAG